MRSNITRYPVDRYLVESSKKIEMVNIIDDDLWNTEPALKPEDEIILRKLHDMLQSTADDLKLLSGELSKFHEPGVQIKTAPTPLDEEFNEKVHIEEIVNAKFHGYKIIDKSTSCMPEYKPRNDVTNNIKPTVNKQKQMNNANVQVNTAPILKKPIIRNLGVTRTNVIQIDGNQNSTKTEKLNNGRIVNAPAVAYNEYSYKYVEPKLNTPRKLLQVQEMPSINIRGELKEQKVLQLDIIPDNKESENLNMITKNIAVVAVQHELPAPKPTTSTTESHEPVQHHQEYKPTVRKVSKMSTCDSSGSTNVSSDTQIKLKTQKHLLMNIKSPKNSARSDRKRISTKKESDKRSHLNLDEWRKKLNVVYDPSYPKKNKVHKSQNKKSKLPPKKSNVTQNNSSNKSAFNNIEYIPYSKLTIGGARASDIEREISDIPNKNNIPLSPILDKILSSRENSFNNNSPPKQKTNNSLKILTTSDENLLQEVIDIEKTISDTLSRNIKSTVSDPSPQKVSSDSEEAKENESYVDDFEDEKSDNSGQSIKEGTYSKHSNEIEKISFDGDSNSLDNEGINKDINVKDVKTGPSTSNINIHNLTYTKVPNLSYKNKIDVFEFVHAVDTQDSATQSNGTQRISPKETQTTPRNDNNVHPIHNDLWPSIDPKGQVEKMFELEKDFIKKLIVEEYGDIIEKRINKPSTSKEAENKTNIAASQKNVQTSPAHVKNVMTSPPREATVDKHTSPLIFVTDEDDVKIQIEEQEDLGISINLSSPRFSLRLPRNFQEVLSNMGDSVPRTEKKGAMEARKNTSEVRKNVTARKSNFNATTTSTSSIEADSSDISSLGEVKLRKILGKLKISSDSESTSSSSSKYSSDFQSGILPLRSEGEMSMGLVKNSNKYSKSEGEASFGML